MWLSKQIAASETMSEVSFIGEVTVADSSKLTVQGQEEYRDIPMVVPFGIAYVPIAGTKAAVTKLNGDYICFGTSATSQALEPGELMLYSAGGASIVLKNDGTVLINGKMIT